VGGGGTIEQNLRKLQLMLNVSWKRRQISQEALNARGFSFSRADVDSYAAKRKRHAAMKHVEHGVDAEYMLLEGADMDGEPLPPDCQDIKIRHDGRIFC